MKFTGIILGLWLALAVHAQYVTGDYTATIGEVRDGLNQNKPVTPWGLSNAGFASTNNLFTVDPNGFTTNGNVLGNRGVLLGGTYLAMSTNYTTAQFTNTALLVLGALPSYASSSFTTYTTNTSLPDLSDSATVVVSADGGTTWGTDPTNTAVLVAIQSITNTAFASSNILIYSYLNNFPVNTTNDLSDRTLLVAPAVNASSPVTYSQAVSMNATAANNWSTFPATVRANLNGKGLKFNGTWDEFTSNNVWTLTANQTPVATITSGSSSNSVTPSILGIAISGTNVLLQVSAASVPTAQYNTDLKNTNGWTLLANQTNWQSVGYWYIQAPQPNSTNAFFRVYVAGTNTVLPTLVFSGAMYASNFVGSMDASNLTGVVPTTVRISPSSVTNDGTQFPAGTVTSGTTNLAGALIATNAAGQRFYSFNGGSLTNLDATKLTGTVPSGNLPALNYVASTNGTAVSPTLNNPTFTGTATNLCPIIYWDVIRGASGTFATNQYTYIAYGTAQGTTTRARHRQRIPWSGNLLSAHASASVFNTWGTNNDLVLILETNDVQCVSVRLFGSAAAQTAIFTDTNFASPISIVGGTNSTFNLCVSNTTTGTAQSVNYGIGLSFRVQITTP